ncbi:MAG: hypothetical protein AAGE43_01015 [Pseudomonadota bacterium]
MSRILKSSLRLLTGSLILLAFLAEAAELPPPSIGVSPSRLELSINGDVGTGTATVLNLSDRDIYVKTDVANFDLDEQNEFRELPTEPGSLPTAIMLNPKEFTVPANSSQTVRFAIMPQRLKGGPGEYRAMLFFSEVVDTSLSAVKVQFRLGMPIYANVGNAPSAAIVHDVAYREDGNVLAMDLSATGGAQVMPSGFYLWWPEADYPSDKRAISRVRDLAKNPAKKPPEGTVGGMIRSKPVFPGARRTVASKLVAPPADDNYKLVYVLEAGGQSVERVLDAPTRMLIVDSE